MRRFESRTAYLFLAAATSAVVIAPLSALALLAPDFANRQFAEDAPLETLTAVSFLSAAFLGGLVLLRRRRIETWMAVAVAFGLLAGLDELSFGERLLGWEPYVVYDVRIDGLHDFLQLTRRFIAAELEHPYWVVGTVFIVAVGAGAAILARVGVARARRLVATVDPSTMLLAAAAGMVFVAQLLDVKLKLLRHPLIQRSYVEEHLELSAGLLVLLFVCLHRSADEVGRRIGTSPMTPHRAE